MSTHVDSRPISSLHVSKANKQRKNDFSQKVNGHAVDMYKKRAVEENVFTLIWWNKVC